MLQAVLVKRNPGRADPLWHTVGSVAVAVLLETTPTWLPCLVGFLLPARCPRACGKMHCTECKFLSELRLSFVLSFSSLYSHAHFLLVLELENFFLVEVCIFLLVTVR